MWLKAVAIAAISSALVAPTMAASNKDEQDCPQVKDPDRAIPACTHYIESKQTSPVLRVIALSNRCAAWSNKGEYDRALADCNEALKLDPTRADAYNNRGTVWGEKQDYDRAIADFSQAILLVANAPLAYLNRGGAWLRKGNYDHAISDFNEVIRLAPAPNPGVAYEFRGEAWSAKGDYDQAIADFNKAIGFNSSNPGAYNDRALVWVAKGDYDRAIADYSEAIRVSPKYSTGYSNRGEAWRLKGDLDRALADQDQAININPGGAIHFYHRGDTRRYRGELELALVDYDQALRLSPNYIPAFTGRGLTLEKMGDRERARAEFKKALASPSQFRAEVAASALETARAHLAALDSGAPLPAIPAAPSKAASETSIPTPVAAAPAAIAASSVPHGSRVALVIGNSAYKKVPTLLNPQHDADAVAATLRAIGFDTVTVANDGTHEMLLGALHAFADVADRAEWAVVYYAGHGIEVNGVNYLIPVDAKLAVDRDVEFEAVPLERIMTTLEGAKKLKLILLDACRDNPFAPHMRRTAAPDVAENRSTVGGTITTRSIGRGLGEVKVSGATLVVYAAKHGQVALDGEGGNSPFAVAVVQRIATPGFEINKVFRLVRDDVMEATAGRQEPYTYGSLPGSEDFYFTQK